MTDDDIRWLEVQGAPVEDWFPFSASVSKALIASSVGVMSIRV